MIYFDNLAIYKEAAAAATFPPRRRRGVESVSRADRGHQYRTGPAAVPHTRGNHPARQPDEGLPGVAGPLGQRVRVPAISGRDGESGVPLRAQDRHARATFSPGVGRGGAFQPMAEGGSCFLPRGRNRSRRATLELLGCAAERRYGGFPLALTIGDRGPKLPTRFDCGRNRWWWTSSVMGGRRASSAWGGPWDWPAAAGDAALHYLCRPPACRGGSGARRGAAVSFSLLDYYRSNASLLWAGNRWRTESHL